MCSPGCSVDCVVPIWKETSKCFWRVPTDGPPLSALVSPASLARPGEKVWSPNEPLVTASEIRRALDPNP